MVAVSLPLVMGGCSGAGRGVDGAALSGDTFAGPGPWPFDEESRVLALDCEGQRVVLEASPAEAWLFLPDQTLQMIRFHYADQMPRYGHGTVETSNNSDKVVAGEQGRYEFDWQVLLTRDGATLEKDGVPLDCRVDRRETPFEAAKLGGADFRAIGNEPGWELVIWWDRMRLRYDYGSSEIEVPLVGPEPLPEETGSRFQGEFEGRFLEVVLRLGPCQDSMSDQIFETRVTVSLDGRSFQGCGKSLH